MIDGARRRALRWAGTAAIIHAIVAVAATMIYCLLLGREISRAAGRFLEVIDWPVYWAIERADAAVSAVLIKDGYSLPAAWPFDPVWTALLVLSLLHAVIGGAFYALLSATLALFMDRRRQQRAMAQSGTGAQGNSE